jgi:ABC-type antimicrobial peptide transport system permease subunit
MSGLKRLFLRLSHVFRPGRADPELARELAAHLTMLEDDFQRRGMMPEEARLAARRALGGVEQVKDLHRDARSFLWLDEARRDLQYAVRTLRKTPGFTAVAVMTLALGIGANAAIFSLIDALLLRSLLVRDPQQLVELTMVLRGGEVWESFSYPLVRGLDDQRDIFSGVCGFSGAAVLNVGPPDTVERTTGASERAEAREASATWLRVLARPRPVEKNLIQERLMATLAGGFGVLALVLAAIGLCGLLAYAVARRTSEIGIRVALGARRTAVMGLVLRETLALTGIGIAIGVAAAAAVTRALAGMLFGLTPLDPVTFIAASLMFAAVALLASYVPARRATQVDPLVALRCE